MNMEIPTFVMDEDEQPNTELFAIKGGLQEENSPVVTCTRMTSGRDEEESFASVQSITSPDTGTEDKDIYLDVSEVEKYLTKPDDKLTVRVLRKILSIMMVILYKTDVEIAKKRKMKSLWERKPDDWPHDVPFKDPNNGLKLPGGRHGQKPVHGELIQMYQFLKAKYLRDVKVVSLDKISYSAPKSIAMQEHYEQEISLHETEVKYSTTEEMAKEIAHNEICKQEESTDSKDNVIVQPNPKPLHPLLDLQYQRLAENFNEVNNIVVAYHPTAAAKLETLGKELETLFEETKFNPDRFNIITIEIGHKTESFLAKAQMLHLSYILSDAFVNDCQKITLEIVQRIKACNAIQSQTYQVGIVMNPAPAIDLLQKVQPDIVPSSLNKGLLNIHNIVAPRLALDQQNILSSPEKTTLKSNSTQLITKEQLESGIQAAIQPTKKKEEVITYDIPRTESYNKMLDDVIDMENEYDVEAFEDKDYGNCYNASQFELLDIQTLSLQSPVRDSVPLLNGQLLQYDEENETATSQMLLTNQNSVLNQDISISQDTEPTPSLTHVQMDVEIDHEADHVDFSLNGIEEVV